MLRCFCPQDVSCCSIPRKNNVLWLYCFVLLFCLSKRPLLRIFTMKRRPPSSLPVSLYSAVLYSSVGFCLVYSVVLTVCCLVLAVLLCLCVVLTCVVLSCLVFVLSCGCLVVVVLWLSCLVLSSLSCLPLKLSRFCSQVDACLALTGLVLSRIALSSFVLLSLL